MRPLKYMTQPVEMDPPDDIRKWFMNIDRMAIELLKMFNTVVPSAILCGGIDRAEAVITSYPMIPEPSERIPELARNARRFRNDTGTRLDVVGTVAIAQRSTSRILLPDGTDVDQFNRKIKKMSCVPGLVEEFLKRSRAVIVPGNVPPQDVIVMTCEIRRLDGSIERGIAERENSYELNIVSHGNDDATPFGNIWGMLNDPDSN